MSPGTDGRRVDEQRDDALAAKTSYIRCRIFHGCLGIDVLHILTGRVMSVGALRSTSMEIPHDVIHWRLPPRAELSDVDQRELVRLVLLIHEDLHRTLSVTDPTVIHPLSVSARGFMTAPRERNKRFLEIRTSATFSPTVSTMSMPAALDPTQR